MDNMFYPLLRLPLATQLWQPVVRSSVQLTFIPHQLYLIYLRFIELKPHYCAVDLTNSAFSHAQLYTALSRVRRREHCAIQIPDNKLTTHIYQVANMKLNVNYLCGSF
jgi:hypothetical protein